MVKEGIAESSCRGFIEAVLNRLSIGDKTGCCLYQNIHTTYYAHHLERPLLKPDCPPLS